MAPDRDVRFRRGLAEELDLTQEDLVDRAGIHRTYLPDIERGMRKLSLVNIRRLAAVLRPKQRDTSNSLRVVTR